MLGASAGHAAIFCHGNVLKYTGTRLFGKGKPIQDAKKAVWYLNKMIEHPQRSSLPPRLPSGRRRRFAPSGQRLPLQVPSYHPPLRRRRLWHDAAPGQPQGPPSPPLHLPLLRRLQPPSRFGTRPPTTPLLRRSTASPDRGRHRTLGRDPHLRASSPSPARRPSHRLTASRPCRRGPSP